MGKRGHATWVALIAALAWSLLAVATAAAGAPRSYIVELKPSTGDPGAKTAALERRDNFTARFVYRHALHGFAARLTDAQVDRLRDDPSVATVMVDRPVTALKDGGGTPPPPPPPPPPGSGPAGVPIAAGELVPVGLRRLEAVVGSTAHAAATFGVAVVDTGIDASHPDLNAFSGVDCTGSGTTQDGNGHGTHVAGTIGARNQGSGLIGVAPGTPVWAVKVLGANGSGATSWVICGLDWVTQNASARGIKVVNMSLGAGGTSDTACGALNGDLLHRAVCNVVQTGVSVVVAAGNSGTNFANSTPAAYPEALTVTAMADTDGVPGGLGPSCGGQIDDRYASFSNYAVSQSDINHTIAAPGVCVRSTYPGGGQAVLSGTSMATPHIAGLVALCYGEAGTGGPCTGLTPAQVIVKLRNDAASKLSATPSYGFTGDPLRPVGFYFGPLAWAGPFGTTTPPPNQSPTASFSFSPSAPTIGQTVSFNGSGSSDPDGTIVSYEWDFGSGTFGAPSSSPSASTSYATAGTYTVRLRVTDNGGATNITSRSVTVANVPPPTQPPVASFTFSPTAPLVGQTVTFNGAGSSDPDGTIVSYAWDLGTGSFGTPSASSTAARSFPSAGTYTVRLQVTDNQGATNVTSRTVTVSSGGGCAPPKC